MNELLFFLDLRRKDRDTEAEIDLDPNRLRSCSGLFPHVKDIPPSFRSRADFNATCPSPCSVPKNFAGVLSCLKEEGTGVSLNGAGLMKDWGVWRPHRCLEARRTLGYVLLTGGPSMVAGPATEEECNAGTTSKGLQVLETDDARSQVTNICSFYLLVLQPVILIYLR